MAGHRQQCADFMCDSEEFEGIAEEEEASVSVSVISLHFILLATSVLELEVDGGFSELLRAAAGQPLSNPPS